MGEVNINWYPGHMTKAKRQMEEDIKLIDIIIEIVDARIPESSRNPDIDSMGKNKYRLIVMNKYDLADDRETDKWCDYFKEKGYYVVKTNSKSGKGIRSIDGIVMEACKEKIERDRKRGIKNRPIRAMVVGIPNVGKSTFINSYAKKACTKTGNKPGVTRGKQWVRLGKNIELLDTPGILWPKFEDEKTGIRLAITGAIKDDILNIDDLSLYLIDYLREEYPGAIKERYGVDEGNSILSRDLSDNEKSGNSETGVGEEKKSGNSEIGVGEEKKSVDILYKIGEQRKCIKKDGEVDYTKAAALLIDDFRSGVLGKITVDKLG